MNISENLNNIKEILFLCNRKMTYWILTKLINRNKKSTYKKQKSISKCRILYVSASSLPYHISGYTLRTQSIALALKNICKEVRVMTRTGYPWDRTDSLSKYNKNYINIDGIDYLHSRYPINYLPVLFYAYLASSKIAKIAIREKITTIHAASNHVNALPALLAARYLGIPFQYEMRGLWELTRISRTPEYEGSQAYKQGLQLEQLVASNADKLFVISEQLGKYVHENWNIAEKHISLLPNCVNPDLFSPTNTEMIDTNTIGYAGSLIGYEGLDTLIDAIDALNGLGVLVKVNIIGDGEMRVQLETQVRRLGLQAQVHFLGKLPPQEARASLSRCALVCIPRKPYEVCQIVPPIKLVEALAMGKPVIVPDLPVFRDELGSSGGGWYFRSGDKDDLAQVIAKALEDQISLNLAGLKARQHAVSNRDWKNFIHGIVLQTGVSR